MNFFGGIDRIERRLGRRQSYLLILLIGIAFGILFTVLVYQKVRASPEAPKSDYIAPNLVEEAPAPIVSEPNLEKHYVMFGFEKNKDKWDIAGFSRDKDGYNCAKPGNFEFRTMWLKELWPVTPLSVVVRVMVKRSEQDSDFTRVILSLGKMEKISELYLPVGNGRVVNFKQYVLGAEGLQFIEPGRGLPSEIAEDTVLTVELESGAKPGGQVAYTYTVEYVAEDGTGTVSKPFNYPPFSLWDTRPNNMVTELGIGIYVGGCIKIVEWGYIPTVK